MKPKAIDLFCGLGGWAEGFLAEGYEVIGFDIEAHDYGTGGYPGTLIVRDVRSIHGSEFKDAVVIVASPPCQKYSYMAMPWRRAKAQAAEIRADLTGKKLQALNELFNECFRIQREAIAAAGRFIPLIVENVRGAQPWVGRAQWNYGSFYLWGDMPALMPLTFKLKAPGKNWNEWKDWDGLEETKPASVRLWGDEIKCGHPERSYRNRHVITAHLTNRTEHGLKVGMNFHEHEKTGRPERSFQSVAVEECGLKRPGQSISAGFNNWPKDEGGAYIMPDGTKAMAVGGGSKYGPHDPSHYASRSNARKYASAIIAKIPFPLALHIARCFKPVPMEATA